LSKVSWKRNAQAAGSGPGHRRLHARQHRRGGGLHQHVLGQHENDRAGPALQRGVEGPRHVLGQPVGAAHLAHPLGHAQRAGAEHLAVVDLLEGLAVALVGGHLADEQDHRRAVLKGGVQSDRRVAGARAARHEADTRAAAQLALRLGHEGRATLVAAGDEADVLAVLVEAIEHAQVAFARHPEGSVHPLGDQCLHQGMAGESRGAVS
jgi:hypothetical protein